MPGDLISVWIIGTMIVAVRYAIPIAIMTTMMMLVVAPVMIAFFIVRAGLYIDRAWLHIDWPRLYINWFWLHVDRAGYADIEVHIDTCHRRRC